MGVSDDFPHKSFLPLEIFRRSLPSLRGWRQDRFAGCRTPSEAILFSKTMMTMEQRAGSLHLHGCQRLFRQTPPANATVNAAHVLHWTVPKIDLQGCHETPMQSGLVVNGHVLGNWEVLLYLCTGHFLCL